MASKSKKTSGNIVNIHGIKAGHDAVTEVVMGDQIRSIQQVVNITTAAQFMEELEKLQAEIATLKKKSALTSKQIRQLEAVEADIQDASKEAGKSQPLGERINRILDGAKETMEKLGRSLGTAVTLGTNLAQLAVLALKLFGH